MLVVAIAGIVVGFVGGFGAAGLAALASFRISQVTARAPLGSKIHDVARTLMRFFQAKGTGEETARELDFEIAWNDLRIHQQILCPSRRIEMMLYLVRRGVREKGIDLETAADLGGQLICNITGMVGAHSSELFKLSALKLEKKILKDWLATEDSKVLGEAMRQALNDIADLKRLPSGEATDGPERADA